MNRINKNIGRLLLLAVSFIAIQSGFAQRANRKVALAKDSVLINGKMKYIFPLRGVNVDSLKARLIQSSSSLSQKPSTQSANKSTNSVKTNKAGNGSGVTTNLYYGPTQCDLYGSTEVSTGGGYYTYSLSCTNSQYISHLEASCNNVSVLADVNDPYTFYVQWNAPLYCNYEDLNAMSYDIRMASLYIHVTEPVCDPPTAPTITDEYGGTTSMTKCTSSFSETLYTGVSNSMWYWWNGSYWEYEYIGPAHTVSKTGKWRAYVTNNCGTASSWSNEYSIWMGISTPEPPDQPSVSADATQLCNGASTTLYASGGNGSYIWSTGQTGSSITVSAGGTYWVVCAANTTPCGSSGNSSPSYITIYANTTPVTPPIPEISSSAGNILCNGAGTTLTASGGNGSYYWSTGQTGSSITVYSAGTYWVSSPGGSNACGTAEGSGGRYYTIYTSNTPAAPSTPYITSSNGSHLCNGAGTVLYANGGNGSYQWSTGQTGSSITVYSAGNYSVYSPGTTNECGFSGNSGSGYYTVTTNSAPSAPSTPYITSSNGSHLCNGAGTVLYANGGNGNYQWSTGQTGSSITVYSAGDYSVYSPGTSNECGFSGNSGSGYYSVTTNSAPAAPATPYITSSAGSLLCNGASTTLYANGGNGNYMWSTGQTGSSITVSSSGSYWVYSIGTSNECGSSGNSGYGYYTITTGNSPAAPATPGISSSAGPLLCNGASTVLTASGDGNYVWSTGQTGSSITVSGAATYWVYSTPNSNACGTSSNSGTGYYTITTGNSPAPRVTPTISSSAGTLLCNGASTVLTASGDGSYVWSTGQTGSSITISGAGTYWVYSTPNSNSCGTSSNSGTGYYTITTGNTPAPRVTPTITSSAGALLCNGAGTVLTASGDGAYIWSTGQTGSSITVYDAGTYSVYSTPNSNSCGSSANSGSGTYTISTGSTPAKPATPTISSSNGVLLCNGASTVLTASGGGNSNYVWSTSATGPTITVTVAGTYTVRCAAVSNSCGTSAPSDPYSVTISTSATPAAPSAPTAISASNGTLLCNGATTTLTASGGSNGSYIWSTGATGPSITVSEAGTYKVRSAPNSNSCGTSDPSAEYSIAVTTGSTPATPAKPTLITSSLGATLCNGATTTLTASGGGSSNYKWSTGATGPTITVSAAGTYGVRCEPISNSCGTSAASDYETIAISTLNTPPRPATPSITSSNGYLLCDGASTTLTASGGNGSYVWSTGATTASITVTAGGTYSVHCAPDENACGVSEPSLMESKTITALLSPVTPATPTILASSYCAGEVTLTASGGGNTNYKWSTGATTPTITVYHAGDYTLQCLANINACGTSESSALTTVTINPTPATVISAPLTNCNGVLLTAPSVVMGNQYHWSTGATTESIAATVTGTYTVLVTNVYGCSSVSSFPMTVVGIPTVESITGGTTVCINKTLSLGNVTPGGTYSSLNPETATVNAYGLVTGVALGMATIKYTVSNMYGCMATAYKSISVDNSCVLSSSCPADPKYELYKNKKRVFDEYTNADKVISGITAAFQTTAEAQSKALANARKEAQDDVTAQRNNWSAMLRGVIQEENQADLANNINPTRFAALADTYNTDGTIQTPNPLVELVLDGLVTVASARINAATTENEMMPASKLPGGQTVLVNGTPCNSFADVFAAYISVGMREHGFTEELLTNPYPFDKKPYAANPNIGSLAGTNVCANIATLQTRWQSAGGSGTFHEYLKQELGDDYHLTPEQLQDVMNKCSAECDSKLLNSYVHMPVAFIAETDKRWIDCNAVTQAATDFATAYPGVTTGTKLYRVLFTNFINHRLGYALSFEEYNVFAGKTCIVSPAAILYNKPTSPLIIQDEMACTVDVLRGAFDRAGQEYEKYIEAERLKFRNSYTALCLTNPASVNVEAELKEYHYTLYYYDLSGNLVKTIPPAGVKLLSETQLDWVSRFRNMEMPPAQCDGSGVPTTENVQQALAAVGTGLLNNTAKSMEMWLYAADQNSGQHVRMITPDNKYMVQAALKDNKLWVEVYTLHATAAPGEIDITLTNQAMADITSALPLYAWTHVVIQSGDNLVDGSLQLYANGFKLTPVTNSGEAYPFEWSIVSGSSAYTLPATDLAALKHLRLYNRTASDAEVLANFYNSCLSPVDALAIKSINSGAQELWARFNIPQPGSATTIASNSTVEYVDRFIVPYHALPTNYAYNSLNQVINQNTPDAGTSSFWYDKLGRLAISQNAEQKQPAVVDGNNPAGRYSYTNYDYLGRIVEVGEKTGATAVSEDLARTPSQLTAWQAQGQNRQVTITAYDVQPSWVPADVQYKQNHLRKRVAASALLYAGSDAAVNRAAASYYNYDVTGNINTLWQENGDVVGKEQSLFTGTSGLKRIDYDYDLVSGKVNKVKYQDGKWDQFYYQYLYDADNRLIKSYSNRENLADVNSWKKDALYRYYLHGPLARMELGDHVQGMDYAYTLQGWLKGVNGVQIGGNTVNGMSSDGVQGTPFQDFNRDAIGFTLGYYAGDYKPIGESSATAFAQSFTAPGNSTSAGQNLYNGNIGSSTYSIAKIDNGAASGQTYRYDQLNRLTATNRHSILSNGLPWNGNSALQAYKEQVSYDPNGNIQTYLRNGAPGQVSMDNLTYGYNKTGLGDLANNRLRHVKDAAGSTGQGDIGDQGNDNYSYDKIGNLKSDNAEGITKIDWTVYGKIGTIAKTDNTNISYAYDAAGNRISKVLITDNGAKVEMTYYVRDAQGNTLGVYSYKDDAYHWDEQHLYGSSRLGMLTPKLAFNGPVASDAFTHTGGADHVQDEGNKVYELTNHLGHVLSTITDKRIPHSTNGTDVDYYEADIASSTEYYVTGMVMPSRNYVIGKKYRFGFVGKENDPDVSSGGQDYGMRIYDGRIGKFLSIDPLTKSYPWNSPYSYAEGDLIRAVDLDGLEKVIVHTVSFAPFDYFGRDPWGTYGGDGNSRKFGDKLTSTVVNSTTINNWRIRSEAALDLATMKTTSRPSAIGSMSHYYADPPQPFSIPMRDTKFAYSKASFDGEFYSGSVAGFPGSTLGLDYHLRGGNAAAPFGAGADIDVNVKINFWKTDKANEIGINGRIHGDRFPSNENYLTDEKNNKLFLGVTGINSSHPDLAPYKELPGDNQRTMSDFNFIIIFNKDNSFKGVRTPSGTEYNLAEWNKMFTNLNPQSTKVGTSVGSSTNKKDDFRSDKN